MGLVWQPWRPQHDAFRINRNPISLPMELTSFAIFVVVAWLLLKKSEQRKHITLLGRHLAEFQIENLMETLSAGYARALGERDTIRRDQVWRHLEATERQISAQVTKFSARLAQLGEGDTRVSTLALSVPYAALLVPRASFDLRQALALHARGIAGVVANADQRTLNDRAFSLSAELFLMQHTCHWFCNSKTVASARLLARHGTTHAQVLAAVAPETRQAYEVLTAS